MAGFAYVGKNVEPAHITLAEATLLQSGEAVEAFYNVVSSRIETRNAGFLEGLVSEGDTFLGPTTGETMQGGMKRHYAILTNRRLIIWARGVLKSDTDSINYADIDNVEHRNGLTADKLRVNARGGQRILDWVDKSDSKHLLESLRARSEAARATQIGGGSLADEVGKLDELRRKGAISDDEFAAMKRRLLGL